MDVTPFLQLQDQYPDLQFVPLKPDKAPIQTAIGWQKTRAKYDFKGAYGIGLVCGALSGGIEVVDVDLKYDHTGHLWNDLRQTIHNTNPDLMKKLTVQRTVSGGYHLIYTCEEIEGNQKLARRPTTAAEREAKPDEKVKVLIETRGEGGQIAVTPMPGYSWVYGDLSTIQQITIEERQQLFSICTTYNTYIQEFTPSARQTKNINPRNFKGITPFEDYDIRGDVIALLIKHGWRVVGNKGPKTMLLRPGDTTASQSGNYDENLNWFSVFSTSTIFEAEKGYRPYAVYAMLEHNGDFSAAAKALYNEGYGERHERAVQRQHEDRVPSRIDTTSDDMSFLARPQHYMDYLNAVRNGTFVKGKGVGFPQLENHWVLKESTLVVVNGHDNVGKSVVIWYFALLSAMYLGWKWIIYSSENSVGSFYRKMIEFYWCGTLTSLTEEQYFTAIRFIQEHFEVIISDEELYNYQDILDMCTKVCRVGIAGKVNSIPDIKGILIDPYNSLKGEGLLAKTNPHEYHYEALSKIKLYGKVNKKSIYVNCHAVTNALRQKRKNGFPEAPQKQDTEGGAKWPAKADDFLTIHREVQNDQRYNITEIHVRKVKETETGGKVTAMNSPCLIKSLRGVVGFVEQQTDGRWVNPVLDWHRIKGSMTAAELASKEHHENPTTEITPIFKEMVPENPAAGMEFNHNFYEVERDDNSNEPLF